LQFPISRDPPEGGTLQLRSNGRSWSLGVVSNF